MRNHAKRHLVQRQLAVSLTLALSLCLGGLHLDAGAAQPGHPASSHQASAPPCTPLPSAASEPTKATRTRPTPAQGQPRSRDTKTPLVDTERGLWRYMRFSAVPGKAGQG